MVLCGTKNGSSMASLEEPFEAPLFLRVLTVLIVWQSMGQSQAEATCPLKLGAHAPSDFEPSGF